MNTMIISGKFRNKNKDTGESDGDEREKDLYEKTLKRVYGGSRKKTFQSDPIGMNLKSAKVFQETGKIVDPSEFIFGGKTEFTGKEKTTFKKWDKEREERVAEELDKLNHNSQKFSVGIMDGLSDLLINTSIGDLMYGVDSSDKYIMQRNPIRWKFYNGVTSTLKAISLTDTFDIATADDKTRELMKVTAGNLAGKGAVFLAKGALQAKGILSSDPRVAVPLLLLDIGTNFIVNDQVGKLYDKVVPSKETKKKVNRKAKTDVQIPSLEDLVSINNNAMIIGYLNSQGIKTQKNNSLWMFQNNNQDTEKKSDTSKYQRKHATPSQKKIRYPGKNKKKQFNNAAKYAYGAMALMGVPLPFLRFANGGMVHSTTYGMVGEDGPEAIIPLGSKRRKRGLKLWNQAGAALGVKENNQSKKNNTPIRKTGSNASNISIGSVTISVKGNKKSGSSTNLLGLLQEQRGQISDELCSILADALEGAYKNIPVAQ